MKPSPLKAFLVDDEPLASERLAAMLERLDVEVVGAETIPARALERLRTLGAESVEGLFLDIHMPGMNGFEFLARLEWAKPPAVVFTTAFDQYAIRAFEVNSVDYLLKPVEPDALARAVGKLRRLKESQTPPDWMSDPAKLTSLLRTQLGVNTAGLRRVASRVGDIVHLVDLEKVSHFIAKDKLTYAVVPQETLYPVDFSIQALEDKLGSRFLRTHRSLLVNLDWIAELNTRFADQVTLTLRDAEKTKLPVSRDRLKAVRDRLSEIS